MTALGRVSRIGARQRPGERRRPSASLITLGPGALVTKS